MAFIVAGDLLASWGQVAAIVLAISLFISTLTGLILVAIMLLGFAWLQEKVELLRRLRARVAQVNHAAQAVKRGGPLPAQVVDNKIISVVLQAPVIAENVAARTSAVEQNVDRGSERVASAVIEFHARTAMIKGMAKAFFLPGLTRRRVVAPLVQTSAQEAESEQEQTAAAAQAPREEPPMEQEIVIRRR